MKGEKYVTNNFRGIFLPNLGSCLTRHLTNGKYSCVYGVFKSNVHIAICLEFQFTGTEVQQC